MIDEQGPAQAAPGPIPTPPDFPIAWETPEEEQVLWSYDRMHFPEPAPPMMLAFADSFNEGFKRAGEHYSLPIRMAYGRINTYFYTALIPTVPFEDLGPRGEVASEKVTKEMGRLWQWWDSELLPEVKEHLTWWEAFDLEGATTPELLSHLDESLTRLARLWHIHFLLALPFTGGPSLFSDFYEDLFPEQGSLAAFKLLQGFGNRTVDSGHALWALSRKAFSPPEVRAALEANEAADVPAALERTEAGRAFLADLDAYLEEYGQRSDVFADLSSPSWIENPATAIQNLKNFMAEPDRDLVSELHALAEAREQLIAEARERLTGYPEAVRNRFEFLLKAGQEGTVVQEDHNYWIDQRATYKVRRVLNEFGRRIKEADVIEDAQDIYLLTLDELRESAESLTGDRRMAVAERKAEMEHFRAVMAPQLIGTPPAAPPPASPLMRAYARFAGEPPAPSEEPDVLNGNACSPGRASGTARVLMSLAEADKLEPGDILIAPSTMPAWTPLFASVAGVVTDAGGVLSHAAIVAREYGIPAVLGTGRATSAIKDGQRVEVDGDAGVVRLIS